MIQIKKLNMGLLRNEEVESFFTHIVEIINMHGLAEEKAFASQLSEELQRFRIAMHSDGQDHCRAVKQADTETDSVWRIIKQQLRINCRHYDADVREAAKAVAEVFLTYEKPTDLPYIEAHARYDHILLSLETLASSLLKRAMIDGWIAELRRCNDAFKQTKQASELARTERKKKDRPGTRRRLCSAWDTLCSKLNGHAVLTEAPSTEKIIIIINGIIDERNQVLKLRRTIKAKKNV